MDLFADEDDKPDTEAMTGRADAESGKSKDNSQVITRPSNEDELAEKEEIIRVLSAQVATKQAQLDEITNTWGWRLLTRYGRLKHRYLLPVYRLLSRLLRRPGRKQGATDETRSIHAGKTGSQVIPAPSRSYDLICFPIADWNSYLFQRSQQLLSQFAQSGYRCFHVHPSFHQSSRAVLAQRVAHNIYSLQLPGPAHVNPGRDEISRPMLEAMAEALDEFRIETGIADALCLVELPFWSPLVLETRRRWGWRIIYDWVDDHRSMASAGPVMLSHEEGLIAASDLVLTIGRILHERASRLAKKTLLLPNAADFEHFNRPGPLRPLSELSRPIIGYYGAISEWFDVEMVRTAAEHRTDWEFVLIGDTAGSNVSRLKSLKNVHLLGRQPYTALPSYLHQFDVACIPFLRTPLTAAADPVKFYEYLSAGKSVVAVDLPELESRRDYFYPVRSPADFVSQIEAGLREQSPETIEARIEFARRNTWRHRYRTLTEAIDAL